MQILRYQPEHGIGQFELPLLAAIRYVSDEIRYRAIEVRRDLWHELCNFKYTQCETIILGEEWTQHLAYVTAALIERRCITSYCPICETHFFPTQIRREVWDDGVAFTGRRFVCAQDHELLTVRDTHYLKVSHHLLEG